MSFIFEQAHSRDHKTKNEINWMSVIWRRDWKQWVDDRETLRFYLSIWNLAFIRMCFCGCESLGWCDSFSIFRENLRDKWELIWFSGCLFRFHKPISLEIGNDFCRCISFHLLVLIISKPMKHQKFIMSNATILALTMCVWVSKCARFYFAEIKFNAWVRTRFHFNFIPFVHSLFLYLGRGISLVAFIFLFVVNFKWKSSIMKNGSKQNNRKTKTKTTTLSQIVRLQIQKWFFDLVFLKFFSWSTERTLDCLIQ